MEQREKQLLEEEFKKQMKLLDQADEEIFEYKKIFDKRTDFLIDTVNQIYSKLENPEKDNGVNEMIENAREFKRFSEQQQFEIEERRIELTREFNKKMNEN